MVDVRNKITIVLVLALVGCAAPRRVQAQFLGYIGQQTVQQTLATSLPCTGTAQTFPINNLGQTQHKLSISNIVGAAKFQAEIDGIDKQGNVFRVSDVLEMPGAALALRQGTLNGSGYFPQIQVLVTCSPGTATFTASYSGSQFTFENDAGSYLAAQVDKISFGSANSAVAQADSFQTPFGSTAGTLYVAYIGTPGAGVQMSVTCGTVSQAFIPIVSQVTLVATTATQAFQIPPQPCPFVTLNYGGGGGAVGSITAEYVFSVPGLTSAATLDPCSSGTFTKLSALVSAVGGATTTQIIAGLEGLNIYVCGYQVSQVSTAGTLQWVYGSGSNCGTGTTSLTGAVGVTASQPVNSPPVAGYVFKTGTAFKALCLTATGGGAVSGVVTYVNAP
jgi:hypothetical protein